MKGEKTGMRQGGRERVMRRERKRYEGTREMKRRKGDEVQRIDKSAAEGRGSETEGKNTQIKKKKWEKWSEDNDDQTEQERKEQIGVEERYV